MTKNKCRSYLRHSDEIEQLCWLSSRSARGRRIIDTPAQIIAIGIEVPCGNQGSRLAGAVAVLATDSEVHAHTDDQGSAASRDQFAVEQQSLARTGSNQMMVADAAGKRDNQ